jgi:hypothetical protein
MHTSNEIFDIESRFEKADDRMNKRMDRKNANGNREEISHKGKLTTQYNSK